MFIFFFYILFSQKFSSNLFALYKSNYLKSNNHVKSLFLSLHHAQASSDRLFHDVYRLYSKMMYRKFNLHVFEKRLIYKLILKAIRASINLLQYDTRE